MNHPTFPHPVAQYIEHTLLKADAPRSEVENLCNEAIRHQFRGICIYPAWIPLARSILGEQGPLIVTVIGFPHGCASSASKAAEARDAIAMGADEIDMVLNLGWAKSGLWTDVEADIRTIKDACGQTPLKVILETNLLTEEEKKLACQAADRAGADFVKTSTGFAGGGATVSDVQLMRAATSQRVKIKASGGIRSLQDAEAMLAAGANTLGTSSGVKIVSPVTSGTPSSSPDKY